MHEKYSISDCNNMFGFDYSLSSIQPAGFNAVLNPPPKKKQLCKYLFSSIMIDKRVTLIFIKGIEDEEGIFLQIK